MEQPPRLNTTVLRGRYLGSTHGGLLSAILLKEGGINSWEREGFIVVVLNKDDYVISSRLISVGNATTVMVSIRDTFREAVAHERWSKIVVAHNHPDGNPTPSEPDKQLTALILSGGKLLGIDVVDHIVIGDDSFYSFTDNAIYSTYEDNVVIFQPRKTQTYIQPPEVPQTRVAQRPPKPADGFGCVWKWDDLACVWYQDYKDTVFGRFLRSLSPRRGIP